MGRIVVEEDRVLIPVGQSGFWYGVVVLFFRAILLTCSNILY